MNSKVGMEQELELATRAESHQAIQRKNSQNQPDTTSQQETPTAARQRNGKEERKEWEATEREQSGGENRRECGEGISGKELHSGLGKREKLG